MFKKEGQDEENVSQYATQYQQDLMTEHNNQFLQELQKFPTVHNFSAH